MKKRAYLIIKIFVSLGLMAFILAKIDLSSLISSLLGARPFLVFAAIAYAYLAYALNTYKWQLLLLVLGTKFNFNKLLRLNFVALYYSLFLPGQLSGEVVKGLKLIRSNKKETHNILTSIIMDRITGLLAIVLTALLGLGLAPSPKMNYQLIFLAGMILVGLTTFFFLILNNKLSTSLEQFGRPILRRTRLKKYLYPTWEALRSYRKDFPSLFKVLFCSLLFQLLTTFINYSVCLSLKVSIPFLALTWIVATVSLAQVLPISISGIGVREGAFIFLLSQFGIKSPEALAVSVMIFAIQVLLGLIGGVVEFTE